MVYVLSDSDSFANVQATIPSKDAGRQSESTAAPHHFRREGDSGNIGSKMAENCPMFSRLGGCILSKIDQDGQGRSRADSADSVGPYGRS